MVTNSDVQQPWWSVDWAWSLGPWHPTCCIGGHCSDNGGPPCESGVEPCLGWSKSHQASSNWGNSEICIISRYGIPVTVDSEQKNFLTGDCTKHNNLWWIEFVFECFMRGFCAHDMCVLPVWFDMICMFWQNFTTNVKCSLVAKNYVKQTVCTPFHSVYHNKS